MADESARDESNPQGPGAATAGGVRDRETHLAWCKQRALAYVDAGELLNAVTSMGADLEKHPETKANNAVLFAGMIRANNGDIEGVRRWIEGWR